VNKIVFNVRRKSPQLTVGSRSLTGSAFQTDGPPTEKARWLIVLRRYRGTVRWCRLAERQRRLATGVQHPTKNLGALFSRHQRTMMASLYSTRSGTLSQWSWSWSSVYSPRSYLRVQVTQTLGVTWSMGGPTCTGV